MANASPPWLCLFAPFRASARFTLRTSAGDAVCLQCSVARSPARPFTTSRRVLCRRARRLLSRGSRDSRRAQVDKRYFARTNRCLVSFVMFQHAMSNAAPELGVPVLRDPSRPMTLNRLVTAHGLLLVRELASNSRSISVNKAQPLLECACSM